MSLFSTLFVDEKAILKGKTYNILLEMNRLSLISRHLSEQILNSVDNAFSENPKNKFREWLELVEFFDFPNQLIVATDDEAMNKIYGKNFSRNSFFQGMSQEFCVEVQRNLTQISLNSGEYVYHSNQIADKSSID